MLEVKEWSKTDEACYWNTNQPPPPKKKKKKIIGSQVFKTLEIL